MALSYKYLTQYPVDQDLFKYGIVNSTTEQAKKDWLRYLEIETLQNTWLLKAAQLEKEYLDNADTTLGLSKKYLSLSMEACLDCMATTDNNLNKLTPHGVRFWKAFTWRKVCAAATGTPSKSLVAGLIGSLASYSYIFPQEDYPTNPSNTIEKLLTLFWLDNNRIDAGILPNEKLKNLLEDLHFSYDFLKNSAEGLEYLLETDNDFKLHLIDKSIITALPLRLLFGDVPDKFISKWSRVQALCNKDSLVRAAYKFKVYPYQQPFTHLQAGLTVARGGGWALVLQSLYIESLLKISKLFLITESINVNNFINNVQFNSIRFQIAEQFALASDVQSCFAIFGTYPEAKLLAKQNLDLAKQWLDTTDKVSLPQNSEYRIPLMKQFIEFPN